MPLQTKIILTIYFILGLPALPLGILWALEARYIFGRTSYFSKDNRELLLTECCSLMIAYTVFFGFIFGLWYLTK